MKIEELIGGQVNVAKYGGEMPFRVSGTLKQFNENGYWVEFISNSVSCFIAFQKDKIKSIDDNLILLKN